MSFAHSISSRVFAIGVTCSALCVASLLIPSAYAQDAESVADTQSVQPIAQFTFDEAAQDGKYVDAITGAQATIHGAATRESSHDGQGMAARISAQQWLDIITKDGISPLSATTQATISYDAKPEVNGNTGWTIFATTSADANPANNETYLGVLDTAKQLRVERYSHGRAGDVGTIVAQNSDIGVQAGTWKHVDIVIDGAQARVYINKRLIATNSQGFTLEQMLGTSGGVLQIGRANWGNGEYYNGLIDNIAIYNTALTHQQLGLSAPTSITLTSQTESDPAQELTLSQGTPAVLTAHVSPETANPDIAWSSADTRIATVDDAGLVQAKSAGTTVITAQSLADNNIQAHLQVNVTAVQPGDAYGYAMVHFIEDRNGYAEKIYLDISQGDNAQRWDPLNNGEPILASNESTTGVRDPYIAYNPENKTFYILATDLRVFGGDNAGWGAWTNNYSTNFHVWSSPDLVHFSDMGTLDTAINNQGTHSTSLTDSVTGSTLTDIGMAWAPEATWVPDFSDLNDDGKLNNSAQGGAFLMYWSTAVSVDGAARSNAVLWAYTTDFTQQSYHFGGVFVPNTRVNGNANTIDTTMLIKGSRAYRMTGSGVIWMQYTDRADWWKAQQNATDPAQGWVRSQTGIGHEFGNAQEGAAGFAAHDGKTWYLYVDNYGSVATGARYGYNPMVTTDLDSATPWHPLESRGFYMAPNTKHGGIVSLTKAQYDAIRQADVLQQDNANPIPAGEVSIPAGSDLSAIKTILDQQTVMLQSAYGFGDVQRSVIWNSDEISALEQAQVGQHITLHGVADTLGANRNHWQFTDAAGTVRMDTDLMENQTPNADNAWNISGGFAPEYSARQLVSTTAIHVRLQVNITEPTNSGKDDGTQTDPVDSGNDEGTKDEGSQTDPAGQTDSNGQLDEHQDSHVAAESAAQSSSAAQPKSEFGPLAATGVHVGNVIVIATIALFAGVLVFARRRRIQ